ncbi:MAG: vitamin K epoxide reductase family protein [Candidatus Dadabacteria bacterium]|nr:vitamin K epoxide reductase family protein [Candidatus Dadabacteria bacterium]NIS09564.1 vitamin K epoxide reductase family protein [Candidatus Dadabacteria bacterium]NIV43073.1 hypothetical protein [Candidatus Dadabacteria bacterium]NIX16038.1 hypothetical protein [Candidatus Dadabacteria bacterium]NIY22741.1 hypothetical protein [Candidatus Dadabacteria bacterium]
MKKSDILILVFAVLGLLISAYLSYAYFSSGQTTFCLSGSGCDVVRESPYSKVFGISVPYFGLIGYLIIIFSLLYKGLGDKRYSLIYYFSLAGVAFSAYLTYLEVAVIKAICPYCVLSAVLVLAILITALVSKQFKSVSASGSKFIVTSLVVFLVVIGGAYIAHSDLRESAPASKTIIDLAKHLNSKDSSMYGSYTCPHCNTQKLMFSDAFKYINYVECNPGGKNPNIELCAEKGIERYPTWEINGQRYEGAKSLKELARLSGFKPAKAASQK